MTEVPKVTGLGWCNSGGPAAYLHFRAVRISP